MARVLCIGKKFDWDSTGREESMLENSKLQTTRNKIAGRDSMPKSAVLAVLVVISFFWIYGATEASAQLRVTYGPQGIQTLAFNGLVLEDVGQYPSDAFHVFHLEMADSHGNRLKQGQYGWGETNAGKKWDPREHAWDYKFVWGSIHVSFLQNGDNLDIQVKEINSAGSGVVLNGAAIYPFALHLPGLPASFQDSRNPQVAFNTAGPSVTVADYGSGEVLAVYPESARPLYSGFWPTGDGIAYYPIISSTAPDGLATFEPHNNRPVKPGETDSFTVALRFAKSGTPPAELAADAYANWARTWPPQLNWADRRAIGTVYLASSPTGASADRAGGYPNNPRRYFNDSRTSDFDVRTKFGLAAFQQRVLNQALENVKNMRRLNAQGSITWDIEGEEYPQNTSYVCEPDAIALIAPEMETTIPDSITRYKGMKLDDAYFKIMTDAGFRVGVCVRPQHFSVLPDGTGRQNFLKDGEIATELIRKIRFAHDRWGATLFYLDSTVEPNGAALDAGILQQVAKVFPDSLIIPEESSQKGYAYTAPFQSFIFHGDSGTESSVHAYYPHAFSAVLINDADASSLALHIPQLIGSVKAGDILMAHVDYWQANNGIVAEIYNAAKNSKQRR